jgi:cobalt-zinc-cadmium efflux system outer membrane protein
MMVMLENFMNTFHKVIVLGAITFCSFVAHAQTENRLRLHDAIQLTLQNNPQLVGYEFRVNALQGEKQTAALKPQTRATIHLENIAGTGDFKGLDAGELTLSLSSVIELGDQRDARVGLVTARQQQLASTQRLLTLDLLTQVTQQFIALAAAQEQLNLLQQTQQLAQENLNSLNKQVQAGRTPEAELLRAKAASARALIATQRARQSVNSERIKLSAFWAETEPAFSQADADLFRLPPTTTLANLLNNLDKNPDLEVLGDEIHLRSAELRQAQAERKINLEWTAGVRRLQVSDDSALVVGLSMPLGSASRASGAIATASANKASAEQARTATRIKLRAELASLHGEYQQALAEITSLRTDVLPQLERAMGATSDAFNQGRYSYLELNLAQRELLDTHLAIIEAAAHAHIVNTEIERLTGATSAIKSDVEMQP